MQIRLQLIGGRDLLLGQATPRTFRACAVGISAFVSSGGSAELAGRLVVYGFFELDFELVFAFVICCISAT